MALDLGPLLRQAFGPQGRPEQLIKRITVRSAYGPDIDLVRPFEGPSTVSPLLKRLQPRVTIEVEGLGPLDFAPYGNPPPTRWPDVVAGLTAAGVIGGFFTVLGIISAFRRR